MSLAQSETRVALTIAGSDSGGGAGIQADLKTFHQHGVFGTSVIVAVTAQNTLGVTAVHAVPTNVVEAQIDAVVSDLPPHASKTGMLADTEHVECVAHKVREHGLGHLVVDPVMVATSGDRLLTEAAREVLVGQLLPLATLVTPNVPEAEVIVGRRIASRDEAIDAARRILDLGPRAVLVTGGHLTGEELCDVFVTEHEARTFVHAKISTDNTHGTGCTLSAAVTANLALGEDVGPAVESAIDFVNRAIASAPALGKGHGPVNHFVHTTNQ